MATRLKLTDVPAGTPRPPRTWNNKTQAWEDLDAREVFLDRFHDRKKDWGAGTISQSLFLRHVELADDLDMYHRNFLEYLEKCWGDHLGIVVTPDILWYTALAGLVEVVKESPEVYRHLFTDSHEKKAIVVVTDNPVVMPLNQLVQELRNHVPTDAAQFMPQFSTTTDAARHAMYASFCDLCSPYYSYGMLTCAFPAISIQGSADDWKYMADRWRNLGGIFKAASAWMIRVQAIFDNCVANLNHSEFWRQMFHLERCGSGSQTEVSGWITGLFYTQPQGPAYVSNFPTNVAKVEYSKLDAGRDFVMQDGLLGSRLEGDFMVPEFGYMVHESLDVEPETYDRQAGHEEEQAAEKRFLARTRDL